jgi:hypothetical protein
MSRDVQVRICERLGVRFPRATRLVVSFQYRVDVDRFQTQVRERFAKFGLELAEEKTRRILFGRFAARMQLRDGRARPDTFEFLGFKHVCGVDRSGRFALIRIPSTKSCRKFLTRTREWIMAHRHWRRWEQQQHLTRMLRGFYQYFALHHCGRKLSWIRYQVQRRWIHALNSRGQRRKTNWKRLKDRPWFECHGPSACKRGSKEMLAFVNVIWRARCGESARRVLLGETRSRSYAHSVRRQRESALRREAPHGLSLSRLVSTILFENLPAANTVEALEALLPWNARAALLPQRPF